MLKCFSYYVPTGARWGRPFWEATKFLPIVLIGVQWCIYLNTVVLYKKIGAFKYSIYTGIGVAFWVFFYFWRIHGSCNGYGWTLDNFYATQKPFYPDGKYPYFKTNNPKPYDYNSHLTGCKYSKPNVCWHFVIDGMFKPIYWSGQECNSKKNMDRLIKSQYTKLLTDPKKQIVAMPLVDTSVKNKKFVMAERELLKQIEEGSRAIPRGDINSVPEEVFLDFGTNPNGVSSIILKDKLKTNEELRNRVKDIDIENQRYNVLNVFIDTISRMNFFRKYPRMTQFLASAKNDPKFTSRVYENKFFTSIKGWTLPNLAASIYGVDF
jgi:hypothetical protein